MHTNTEMKIEIYLSQRIMLIKTHITRKLPVPIQRKKVDVFDFLHFHIRRAPKCPEESFIYRISKKNLSARWWPPKVSKVSNFSRSASTNFLPAQITSQRVQLVIYRANLGKKMIFHCYSEG
jgi:hypothetical protein